MARDNLSDAEVEQYFIRKGCYGVPGEGFPSTTVLLLKVYDGKAKLRYRQWFGSTQGSHAEKAMLDWIRGKEIRNNGLKITMNYSPCSDCADTLLSELPGLLGPGGKVEIYFSNFYKRYAEANIAGLTRLDEHDKFTLDVIDSWDKFETLILDAAYLKDKMAYFYDLFHSEIRNAERDEEDREFLENMIRADAFN